MPEFCRYDQDEILEPLILASVQNESPEFVSGAPSSDNIFIRIRGRYGLAANFTYFSGLP